MQKLNFPTYSFRFKNSDNKLAIFDEIRKKFVLLTPEEWVRQNAIQFLVQEKSFPKAYINVERLIKINNLNKRYDIVVFQPNGKLFLLIECKAPEVAITQKVFDQISQYNSKLKSKYLMVTNGHKHYFCQLDYEKGQYVFLADLPNFTIE